MRKRDGNESDLDGGKIACELRKALIILLRTTGPRCVATKCLQGVRGIECHHWSWAWV